METQPTQGLVSASQGSGQTTKSPLMGVSSGFGNILAGLKPGNLADDVANSLPLEGQGLPQFEMMDSLALDEESLGEAGLGFYAQTLVSSLLSPQGNGGLSPSYDAAANNSISLGDQFRKELSSLNLDQELEGESEVDLGSPLYAEAKRLNDRFLGAQGSADKLGLSLATTSTTEISTEGSAQVLSSPLAALQVETSLAAANSNEDPIIQSLQDLNHLEDAEKAEVESKLMLGERKQDDQILKLTKGQQAWGDALTERISMNAAKDIKQVTIHLDPPELGSLELKMQVKDDQQTQVIVQVQNPQVKEALESSAQRLRDMLASQGLELSEFDVQTSPDQGQGGQGDGRSADSNGGGRFAHEAEQDLEALDLDSDGMPLYINLPKNNNLLDTFV